MKESTIAPICIASVVIVFLLVYSSLLHAGQDREMVEYKYAHEERVLQLIYHPDVDNRITQKVQLKHEK